MAYRTTLKAATGETPFSLTHGAEVVISAEFQVLNARTSILDLPNQYDVIWFLLDQLKDKRDKAFISMETYRNRMVQLFKSRVGRHGPS